MAMVRGHVSAEPILLTTKSAGSLHPSLQKIRKKSISSAPAPKPKKSAKPKKATKAKSVAVEPAPDSDSEPEPPKPKKRKQESSARVAVAAPTSIIAASSAATHAPPEVVKVTEKYTYVSDNEQSSSDVELLSAPPPKRRKADQSISEVAQTSPAPTRTRISQRLIPIPPSPATVRRMAADKKDKQEQVKAERKSLFGFLDNQDDSEDD